MALDAHKINFMGWFKQACDYHQLSLGWRAGEMLFSEEIYLDAVLCRALEAGGPVAVYKWVNDHRQWLTMPPELDKGPVIHRDGPRRYPVTNRLYRRYDLQTQQFRKEAEFEIAQARIRADIRRQERIRAFAVNEAHRISHARALNERKLRAAARKEKERALNRRIREMVTIPLLVPRKAITRPIDMGGIRDIWLTWTPRDQATEFA
jgi:hypothetical protein